MFEQPIKRGLKQRCARCGQGSLFRSYLKFRDECPSCGQDFSVADTADGPAFFVGFLVMILFAPFYFILPMVSAPLVLKIVLWIILLSTMFGLALLLLPLFKAVLFNLQIRNRAEEAKWESTGSHGKPPRGWNQ
ncbi:DUF983 domain-containing protein [Henriciella pelagia]|jgi:uncharacterized protein (DUF983 family)|uniref:DUF983 domain-containing protein n=1 Tax=Henriciella pelagia TaxID=1977912 RepID=A0ABQ1J7T7_9PROT|nr:DUF983 domain-containing protein [Henriciella pelagia]GGB60809.1 hypothetical protein GCM10011503_06640 [Henriciella pelagia]